MPTLPPAPLDQRVKLLTELPVEATPVLRVSDLRAWPHVVLLGEPGMGKSTVLEREAAAAAGTRPLTVRAFVHGATAAVGAPLGTSQQVTELHGISAGLGWLPR